ncbi:MAG: SDR family oxidoreductase [Bauldia sp.]|nr:SDR family oxidoreductase [Bauldia sp.]
MSRYATYPSLKDKVVFITGGATGIGASVVEHFCAQGSKVTFVDIAEDAGNALVDRIATDGFAVPTFVPGDLTDVERLGAVIAEVGDKQGPVGVLVNNAGNDDRHLTPDVDRAYWDDRIAVNLRHQFFAAQAVYPQMKAAGGGSIVNFGSISWKDGEGNCPVYLASKAAVTGMSRGLAREFGPYNIRVNIVVPGWVMTERQLALWVTPEGEEEIDRRQCLKPRLMPEHIAKMVLFLGADDSAMCTKQEFIVDAGWV